MREEMIERQDTAVGEKIEVDIGHQVVQRMEVAEGMTVGKLPQVVCTALERMIHIPHLVIHHRLLAKGEGKARHSVEELGTTIEEQKKGPHKCARTLTHRTIHRGIASAATTTSCFLCHSSFVLCESLLQICW